jgi:trans-aconitate methyltransferase
MSVPPEFFDDLYRREGDPWGFIDRWYERRKYALTMAALPRATYENALEVGSSIGVFTRLLAPRCTRLLAIDASEVALAAARLRLHDVPNVELERHTIPAECPDGRYDLIVFSEVGYWLSRRDLEETLAQLVSRLTTEGDLIAVHWRPPGDAYELTGDAVHAALRKRAELQLLGSYAEAAFLLDVFRRSTTPA